jgi:hypothetical protein
VQHGRTLRLVRGLAVGAGAGALIIAATIAAPSGAGASLAAGGCQTGTTYTSIRMAPQPIATFGSLKPSQQTQFFAEPLNVKACVAGATVYLSVDTHVKGDSTAVPASQCHGVTLLTSTPTACTTDATGKVTATYTSPGTLPANGAVQVTARQGSNKGFFTRDFYLYESLYRFSVSPIAQPGSLAAGHSVSFNVSALGVGGAPQTKVNVCLSLKPSAGGGGSAGVGGTKLTATPKAFATDINGMVSLTYTAPATLPSSGIDTITAGSSGGSTLAVFNTTAYAFDSTTPVISVGDVSQTEADNHPDVNGEFNVTLSRPSSSAISLFYQTDCGVGDKGCKEDYLQSLQPTPRHITIAAGQVHAVINLRVYSYSAPETYNETMFMQLIQPSGVILGRSLGAGILFPDDETSTAQQLYVGDTGVVPSRTGTEFAEVVVVLANPAASPVTFSYATSNGTALSGVDYTAASGTATIGVGSNAAYIEVPILSSSATAHAPKTLTVTISNAHGATINRAAGVVSVIYLNA